MLRGFSYETSIYDISAMARYLLIGGPKPYIVPTKHCVYIAGGIGLALSTPTVRQYGAVISDEYIASLDETGSNEFKQNYVLFPSMPLSIGYNYQLTLKSIVGCEARMNVCLTGFVKGFKSRFSRNNQDIVTNFSVYYMYRISMKKIFNRKSINN